jgi:thioredoxin-related protein
VEVLVMAVNDSADAMREFMDDGGWSLPVMMGADDAAREYGVRAIPMIFVVDTEGRIVKKIVGEATAETLSEVVDGITR